MQLVEVPGENAYARCVPETVLHGWVVQPAENLQMLEVIGKLVQQGWRLLECAVRLRDQFGLIETEVINDREQAPRRIHFTDLPQALHAGKQQGNPRPLEKGASFHDLV